MKHAVLVRGSGLLGFIGRAWLSCAILACGSSSSDTEPEPASGDDTDSGSSDDDSTAADTGADSEAPQGESLGGFYLRVTGVQPATALEDEKPAVATLQGSVTAIPTPATTDWVVTFESGECHVHEPRRPFCDPPCEGTQSCAVGDTCADVPANVSVGDVTVTGAANAGMTDSFVMQPLNSTTNSYSAYGDARLVYPPLDEGATLALAAEGGDLEPFAIQATGISVLQLNWDGELPFVPDEPLELSWQPGNNPDARIEVVIDISHHGGTKGEIVCDTEDDGSVEIAGELVTKLIDLGVAGYPEVRVERHSTGYTNLAGNHAVLDISSRQVRLLAIEGLRSCKDDEACEDGEVCRVDSTCGSE